MTVDMSGVLVPLTTPFDVATGDVAAVALRNNARALLDQGVAGFVASGSTGEASMLSEDEARQVVAWLRDVTPDDRLLIVGAGRESTRGTIQACRAGWEEGADAALVRAPSYYASALNQAALADHFRAVADASPIPILVYNIPKYTHLSLSDTLLASLADHGNIVGAKDSSGDLKHFASYRDAVPKWHLFVGSGAGLYAALELGAVGGIVAVANYAAETAVAVFEAFRAGDKAAAGSAQEVLTPLHKEIVAQFGPAGVKAAMDVVGLFGGPVRAPLPALDDSQRAAVTRLLERARLIPA
jgi:dihydrodipicolinate synthase/N-acetylneuraminate lyase